MTITQTEWPQDPQGAQPQDLHRVPTMPTPPSAAAIQVILKRFEHADEVREMLKGRFEVVRMNGMTLGRARYEPGWRWSEHVGPSVGASRCTVEHLGLVLSGVATAAFDDGRVYELTPGTLFYIPATPHDSWVVGDEAYVSLHFLGADRYATQTGQPPGA